MLSITAAVGAVLKLATLGEHGHSVSGALTDAALRAPPAIVGSLIGAALLHRMPVTLVRTVMTVIILAVATRLM